MTLLQRDIADVLLHALPSAYSKAHGTYIDKEVMAHALALSQTCQYSDILLSGAVDVIPQLISEYEHDYGLPRACQLIPSNDIDARVLAVKQAQQPQKYATKAGLIQLFSQFGIVVQSIRKTVPARCTFPCNQKLNTERHRFKLTLNVVGQHTALIDCITSNYLPHSWLITINEV